MNQATECPRCRKSFRVPEGSLGKKVKCPDCAAVFTALPAPEGPPRPGGYSPFPPPAEEAPAPPRLPIPADQPEAAQVSPCEAGDVWSSLALGALLQGVANLLLGLVLLVLLLVVFAAAAGAFPPPGRAGEILLKLFLLGVTLLATVGVGLDVTAGGFWVLAPVRHGARGLAVAMLVLTAAVLLSFSRLGAGFMGLLDGPRMRGTDEAFLGASALFNGLFLQGRIVLLGCFLVALARGLPRRDLRGSAFILAVATPLVFLGAMFVSVVVLLLVEGGRLGGVILALINILALIGLLLWQTMVLLQLRPALKRAADEA